MPVGCGGRHPTLTSLAWDREELQAPQAVLMSWEPPKKVRFDTKKLATRDGTRNRGDAVSDGRRRPHLPCAFLVEMLDCAWEHQALWPGPGWLCSPPFLERQLQGTEP